MKTSLSVRLFQLTLLCTWAVAILTGTSASAKPSRGRPVSLSLPTMVVSADSLTLPEETDEVITTPDDCIASSRLLHPDSSFALPDGTLLVLPMSADSDGTVLLPDGGIAARNVNGTLTLEDGSVLSAVIQLPDDTARPATAG